MKYSDVWPTYSKSNPIRILLVDDHDIVRSGLRALFETEERIKIVGEARDGQEAILKAQTLNPDIILLDLVMPLKDGIDVIHELGQQNCKMRIFVLTSYLDDEKIFMAIKAGALGYMLKESAPADLIQAIYEVSEGESSVPPAIARKLILELNNLSRLPPSDDLLTEGEEEILAKLASGLPIHEIADILGVCERTIRTHINGILVKLHLANRNQTALFV